MVHKDWVRPRGKRLDLPFSMGVSLWNGFVWLMWLPVFTPGHFESCVELRPRRSRQHCAVGGKGRHSTTHLTSYSRWHVTGEVTIIQGRLSRCQWQYFVGMNYLITTGEKVKVKTIQKGHGILKIMLDVIICIADESLLDINTFTAASHNRNCPIIAHILVFPSTGNSKKKRERD